MKFTLSEVAPSWQPFFRDRVHLIDSILDELGGEDISPPRDLIFRAFTFPVDEVKVVIVGQDPYPGSGVADGLAFSTRAGNPRPASLRNIFKEYTADLGYDTPLTNDLTPWARAGVCLLNRTLTTTVGERNAHLDSQWKDLTADATRYLGNRGAIGILWGKYAQQLSPYFSHSIISSHPSPLSARRSFFGSKPFTKANQFLRDGELSPVDWRLS